MKTINLLSEETIDKIAAGEVIEKPASVAKELVENSIDAGATAITVEIKDGGISMLRVSDNGEGIAPSQLPSAFMRHATSKIKCAEDLDDVSSLGFRGEALSSILAVSQVEVITKTEESIIGSRYIPSLTDAGRLEEIGAPNGTTFVISNIFYNTPARRKFLKSEASEGAAIADLIEKLALSRPDIAFKFISQGKVKLNTPGNGKLKDTIFSIYGKDVVSELLEVDESTEYFHIHGFIAKPVMNRATRSFETIYVNNRFVRSQMLSKAVEEGYHGFLMQRQFPFCILFIDFPKGTLDVNVHPTKMDLRVSNEREVAASVVDVISRALLHKDYAVDAQKISTLSKATNVTAKVMPSVTHIEPFEKNRLDAIRQAIRPDTPYEKKYEAPIVQQHVEKKDNFTYETSGELKDRKTVASSTYISEQQVYEPKVEYVQESFEGVFSAEQNINKLKLVGQIFGTYWIVQFEDKMYIMDQHAAHEKVLYERTVKKLRDKTVTSQMVSPPLIVNLSVSELETVKLYENELRSFGYEIEPFGGREYAISAIPGNLYHLDEVLVFHEIVAGLLEDKVGQVPEIVLEKIASMSCKAAIKGNNEYTHAEVEELITELFTLDDPYHCPHGRPTLISFTQYELDRKFRRIV